MRCIKLHKPRDFEYLIIEKKSGELNLLTYRSEIDGLRAVAVLFVIFYHLGLLTLGVGFAGVDVFFVISGYLIGGLILQEKAAGTFRFREFYARRARRILPALFAVILVTVVCGWFLMLPRDYRYFLGGAFTAVLSLSNIWFAERIGYFTPEAAQDPLVHTWTLGVEEQFYLFVPLIIVASWRYIRSHLFHVLVGLTVASFALALYLSQTAPQWSYYLLPTRAWELFAGVLIAMKERELRSLVSQKAAGVIANLSLLSLVVGILAIPNGVDWPGVYTLLPVGCTALLLAFGNVPSAAKLVLSLPPMRAVGLVSYSAYLVHQPILGFLAYTDSSPVSLAGKYLILIATFIFAYVSWRFIETPFRQQKLPKLVGRGLLIGAGLSIFLVALIGNITKGYPSRMPAEVSEVLAVQTTFGPNNKRCLLTRKQVPDMNLQDACVLGTGEKASVAIWGDSHGAAMLDALAGDLAKQGLTSKAYLLSSCLPIPGLLNHGQKRTEQCASFNDQVLVDILGDDSIHTVVLVATWDNYFLSKAWPNMLGWRGEDGFYSYPVDGSATMPEDARQQAVFDAAESLVETLVENGKSVVIVQSAPRPNVIIPRHFARGVKSGRDVPQRYVYDRRYFEEQTEFSHQVFETIAGAFGQHQVALAHPEDVMCDVDGCAVTIDHRLLFSDGNHLSVVGAKLVSPIVAAAVTQVN